MHKEHFEGEKEFSFKSLFVPLTTLKGIYMIIIMGFIVFTNCLFNGFVGDDAVQILTNPLVHSLSNIPKLFLGSTFNLGEAVNGGLYYKPLMSLVITIVYVLFGPHAFAFHLLQVLLHITNTILLFFIFRRFFNINISTLLTLLFLVHPINVEAVAYISNIQDVLFFFFGIVALYLEIHKPDTAKKNIVISSLLLLSLFSKETGILFTLTIIGYRILFNKNVRQILFSSAVMLMVYIFFRIVLAQVVHLSDSSSSITQVSFGTRLLNVPVILIYYFKTVFFPLNLAVAQVWFIGTQDVGVFYLSILILGILIACFILLGNILYSGDRMLFKTYTFFLFILYIGLLLHSQIFFALDATVADRWFYFPMVGLLGIIGVLLQMYKKKLEKIPQVVIILFIIALLSILSVRSIIRNNNFYDNYTLASHDIRYSQESSLLTSLLGVELMNRGRYQEAEPYLLKSVKLDPKGQLVWNVLGVYYEAVGQPEKAQSAYTQAIKNGNFFDSYFNLTLCYFINDKPKMAEKIARDGLQRFPTNGQLWQLYTLIENKLEKKENAIEAAKRAAQYTPISVNTVMYTRLSQNLPISTKIVSASGKSKKLLICLPDC